MKTKALLFALAFTSTLFFVGCKEEATEGSLTVRFELVKNGETVELNENFSNDSLPLMRVELLKYYISHLTLGANKELEDVEIIDFKEGRTSFKYESLQAKSYGGISFYVGLDSTQNAAYPPDLPTGTPLSASWAMYWSWAMKYRFIILEGRGATDGAIDGSSNDITITLHPGMDGWQRLVSSENGVTIKGGENTTVVFQIDVDEMFNGPGGFHNLQIDHTTHTTPEDMDIALKFTENFAAAIHRK